MCLSETPALSPELLAELADDLSHLEAFRWYSQQPLSQTLCVRLPAGGL